MNLSTWHRHGFSFRRRRLSTPNQKGFLSSFFFQKENGKKIDPVNRGSGSASRFYMTVAKKQHAHLFKPLIQKLNFGIDKIDNTCDARPFTFNLEITLYAREKEFLVCIEILSGCSFLFRSGDEGFYYFASYILRFWKQVVFKQFKV